MKNTRFVATEESLDVSEALAKKMGIPIERDKTRQLTDNLLDLYFSDIVQVLPKISAKCQFESFATRDFRAFASPIGSSGAITIDQQWSFFLLDANFLVCLQAFHVLDTRKQQLIDDLFLDNLNTLANPHSHEVLREKIKPLLFKHTQELLIANILTKTVFGFMICHEMAHINLKHFDQKECEAIEFEADKGGLKFLMEISRHFEELNYLNIPPNFIGAPMLSFYYLHALEKLGIIEGDNDTHPAAKKRLSSLKSLFNHTANDEAKSLFQGLAKGCEDILGRLKLD